MPDAGIDPDLRRLLANLQSVTLMAGVVQAWQSLSEVDQGVIRALNITLIQEDARLGNNLGEAWLETAGGVPVRTIALNGRIIDVTVATYAVLHEIGHVVARHLEMDLDGLYDRELFERQADWYARRHGFDRDAVRVRLEEQQKQ